MCGSCEPAICGLLPPALGARPHALTRVRLAGPGDRGETISTLRKVFLVFSNSPVSGDPRPIAIVMTTNPYPAVIWRGAGTGSGAVIGGCRRGAVIGGPGAWTIVVRVRSVRSTVGTEWSSHNSCRCPDDGCSYSKRKKKRVAVVAIFGPCARSGNNHKKSKPNGR